MSGLLPDDQVFLAYQETRQNIIDLLRDAPESAASTIVPTCPSWTVADLAAHIFGVPDDIMSGRMQGVGSDEWTQEQVERMRGTSLADLATAIEQSALSFDTVMPMIPAPANSQIVMDTVTHEHDLRNALGRPGAHDSLGVTVALSFLLGGLAKINADYAAALSTCGASEFELMRTLSGRRTADQARAAGIDWSLVSGFLDVSPMSAPTTVVEK